VPLKVLQASQRKRMSNNNKKGGGQVHPKKESILELAKLMDATVRVKCLGGRELRGTLRGYDDLVNLVLDDCDEFLRGMFCLGGICGCVCSLKKMSRPDISVLFLFCTFFHFNIRSRRLGAGDGSNAKIGPGGC
jgi:small nuclear ribonucleoprotein (snRNP)-like protein